MNITGIRITPDMADAALKWARAERAESAARTLRLEAEKVLRDELVDAMGADGADIPFWIATTFIRADYPQPVSTYYDPDAARTLAELRSMGL